MLFKLVHMEPIYENLTLKEAILDLARAWKHYIKERITMKSKHLILLFLVCVSVSVPLWMLVVTAYGQEDMVVISSGWASTMGKFFPLALISSLIGAIIRFTRSKFIYFKTAFVSRLNLMPN